MPTIAQRFGSLPRAGRWLVVAGAVLIGYLLAIEPAMDAIARLSARADLLQGGLDRTAARADRNSEASQFLSLIQTQMGEPLEPGSPSGEDRVQALSARIESVLRERAVEGLSIKSRAMIPLGRDVMAQVVDASQQLVKVTVDVEFEASPEEAMTIVAELEQAPEVAALGRLSMRKSDRNGRKVVQVSVSPEAWMLIRKGARR